MDTRIVRLEDDFWRIRTDIGELAESERNELKEYFDEIKMPYKIIAGSLCISGRVDRDAIFERVEHFYDGRAEVYPF
jgi:hypothetical protein